MSFITCSNNYCPSFLNSTIALNSWNCHIFKGTNSKETVKGRLVFKNNGTVVEIIPLTFGEVVGEKIILPILKKNPVSRNTHSYQEFQENLKHKKISYVEFEKGQKKYPLDEDNKNQPAFVCMTKKSARREWRRERFQLVAFATGATALGMFVAAFSHYCFDHF